MKKHLITPVAIANTDPNNNRIPSDASHNCSKSILVITLTLVALAFFAFLIVAIVAVQSVSQILVHTNLSATRSGMTSTAGVPITLDIHHYDVRARAESSRALIQTSTYTNVSRPAQTKLDEKHRDMLIERHEHMGRQQDQLIRDAIRSVKDADFVHAEKVLLGLYRRGVVNAQLYTALGEIYAAGGQWQKASNDANCLYNLAVSYDHLQQYPAAKSYYKLALNHSGSTTASFPHSEIERRVEELAQW